MRNIPNATPTASKATINTNIKICKMFIIISTLLFYDNLYAIYDR